MVGQQAGEQPETLPLQYLVNWLMAFAVVEMVLGEEAAVFPLVVCLHVKQGSRSCSKLVLHKKTCILKSPLKGFHLLARDQPDTAGDDIKQHSR